MALNDGVDGGKPVGISSSSTCRPDSREEMMRDLQEYHYSELYDDAKQYNGQQFQQDFGHGMLWYKYTMCRYLFQDSAPVVYVAAVETSANLTDELQAHCQCYICRKPTASWWDWLFNLAKPAPCSCCVGCLKSGMIQQYQVNRARAHMIASQTTNK